VGSLGWMGSATERLRAGHHATGFQPDAELGINAVTARPLVPGVESNVVRTQV
jgi:hypothetical protein